MQMYKLPWVDISDKYKPFHKCFECVVVVHDVEVTFTAFIDMVYSNNGDILYPTDKCTGFVSAIYGMQWGSFDTIVEALEYCQNIYDNML